MPPAAERLHHDQTVEIVQLTMNGQNTYFTLLDANTPPYTGTLPIPSEIEQLAKDINEILTTKMNTIRPKQPQGGRKWLSESGKSWSKHFTKYGWIKTDSVLFRYWMDTRLFAPWVWRNLATSNLDGKSTKLITFFWNGSKKIVPDCSTPETGAPSETASASDVTDNDVHVAETVDSSDTPMTEASTLDVTDNDVNVAETIDSSYTSMTDASAMDTTDNYPHVADQVGTGRRKSNRIVEREEANAKWFFKCRECGLTGENVGDDGRPSMRCDKCDTWSHFTCSQALGIVDDELTLGDIAEQGFVCENCRTE